MDLPASETADKSGSRSVRRAISILEMMLARGEGVPVAAIVAELGIPKSTVYELVRTLEAGSYLERDGRDGSFFLGRKLFELGMAYRARTDLLRDGAAVVEWLRDSTGETVQLSVLEGENMLVLFKEEGSQPVRIISRVGSRVPPSWAAAGRLLVSDLNDAALRDLLARTAVPSPSGRAVTEVDTLVEQVRRFRAQGYATEVNEANLHAGCVAAPVLGPTGRCVAALSVVAPEQRLGDENRARLIAAVREAAARLSRRLGAG